MATDTKKEAIDPTPDKKQESSFVDHHHDENTGKHTNETNSHIQKRKKHCISSIKESLFSILILVLAIIVFPFLAPFAVVLWYLWLWLLVVVSVCTIIANALTYYSL